MTDLWLTAASRLPEPSALEAVRELADRQNVNVIWQQATPLLRAAGHAAHFQVADQLLRAGASPKEVPSLLGWKVNSRDSDGQTALHKAAFADYSSAIRALIELKADPVAKASLGLTPLDIARRWNKPAAIKALARAA
jgi:ankyrin repeat protein